MSELFEQFGSFLGRFHPLLVHLPIGILSLLIFYLIWARIKKKPVEQHLYRFVLWSAAIFSTLASLTGWLLSQEGGYGSEALMRHQWAGIILTATIYGLLLLQDLKYQRMLIVLSAIMLMLTGHLGGNLTHGEGYLTENLPGSLQFLASESEPEFVPPESYSEAVFYNHLVRPVFKDKCHSCHNANKMKGELNMANFEMFLKGGEGGKAFKLGQPSGSDLIRRIELHEEHDETMPPEGKDRITASELSLISFWIENDGQEATPLDSLDFGKDLEEEIRFRLSKGSKKENPVFALKVSEGSEEQLNLLKQFGFTVNLIDQNSHFVQVNHFDRSKVLGQKEISALLALKDQLLKLDLSGMKVENDDWSFVLQLHRLTHLNLSQTTAGDGLGEALKQMPYLEYLNLFASQVTEKELSGLEDLPQLRDIYLGQTPVDSSAVGSLTNNEKIAVHF